jgi:hypothetical protein
MVNTVPDYETHSSYFIRVRVTDQSGLAFEKPLTISVADQNDAPLLAPNQSFSISEALLNGGKVGEISGSDPDTTAPNNTLTYAIVGGNIGNAFAIEPSTGRIFVNDHLALDFNATPQYALEVSAADAGPGNLTASTIVVVNILDANDPPTIADSADFTLPEHSPLNTPLGTITAIDDDEGSVLVFRIVEGNTASAFAIDASSGLLTVSNPSAINFEVTHAFILTIEVQDEFGASDSTSVTVHLTDIDDALELQLGSETVTWINKRAPSQVMPEVTITGLEPVGGGMLIITVNAAGTAKKVLDSFNVPGHGSLGTSTGLRSANGQSTLQIQLNAGTTAAQIQTLLRGITFSTKGKGFKVPTRTVTVSLTDSGGATNTFSQTINVRKKA